MWKLVLLLGLLKLAAGAEVSRLNAAVDRLLNATQGALLEKVGGTLQAEDLWVSYNYRYLFWAVKVERSLHCREGRLERMHSLRRAGDVLEFGGLLTVPLTLHDAELHFNNCRLEVGRFLREADRARIDLRPYLELRIQLPDRGADCGTAKLTRLGMSPVGTVKVSSPNILLSFFGSWVRDRVREYIDFQLRGTITSALEAAMSDRLQEIDFCGIINPTDPTTSDIPHVISTTQFPPSSTFIPSTTSTTFKSSTNSTTFTPSTSSSTFKHRTTSSTFKPSAEPDYFRYPRK